VKFKFVTLFPELIESYTSVGIVGSARRRGLLSVDCANPRDFTDDRHRTVDDRVFGGGDGMVMKAEPIARAVESLGASSKVVVLSPQGRLWHQDLAKTWSQDLSSVTLVCGRYAGIDQRLAVALGAEEVSVGDYVLSGGELAALAILDSLSRYVPGVLGHAESVMKDSFANAEQVFEAPQFTRPEVWRGLRVPAVLLSGDHALVDELRRALSVVHAFRRRPELVARRDEVAAAARTLSTLSREELDVLALTPTFLRELLEAAP
jgi:tRNA (guanine37-N1)-methyltransferase